MRHVLAITLVVLVSIPFLRRSAAADDVRDSTAAPTANPTASPAARVRQSPAVGPSTGGSEGTPAGAAIYQLPETIVTGRQDSLIGIAAAASEGSVGQEQLQYRTLSRPGEILETVPGLIITQHSGGGKANQYFLRGFNLDHGTDFASSVNGVPVNLPTHAHGQGYSDLNFMIPDLIERIDFRKGVYYADLGDFSSAGAADVRYYDVLPHDVSLVEGGRYGYVRVLYASSPAVGAGHLLNALEVFHEDGPWTKPDDYQKINGVLRYSQGDASGGFDVTAMAYAGKWNSTDQIARRALGKSVTTPFATTDDFHRFDSLDPSDGGRSQRYGLSSEWHRVDDESATKILLYGFYYDLDLFSNFTYFLHSPEGDQFEQADSRWVGGLHAAHTWFGHLAGRDMQNTAGIDVRSYAIRTGLFNTVDRHRTAKFAYEDGTVPSLRPTTRTDQVWEPSIAPYIENRIQWTDEFRTVVGARVDYFHIDDESHVTANSGTEDAVQVSPKGSLIAGPWFDTEFYLSGGMGFHSNDGRGATEHVDPTTGAAVKPDDLLVRTYGAEVGARTTIVPGLQSTFSFWWLRIGSELVFEGDAGSTAPSAPSQRYGAELANYYQPNDWLTLDADFALSHAAFTRTVDDGDTHLSGTHVPEAVKSVVATGIALHQPGERGPFSELRLRYFGPRDLSVGGHPESGGTALLSAKIGYNFGEHVALGAEVFNILNRKDHDIDYYYPSFIPGVDAAPAAGTAPAGVNDVHFKTVEPISFRVGLTVRF